jgi:isopenicillin-N N-acyltransferase-like protein
MLTAICVLSLLAISALTPSVQGAYCHGSPAPGERVNEAPIIDEKLTHIRSVKNGMLFEAGPANARFPVVHVWGTPYEVGYAQGTIRKEAIVQFVAEVWEYLITGLTPYITNDRIPQILKDAIVSKTLDRALDWSRKVTEDFTPQAYKDELQGIADATGISYDMLYR